MDPRWRLFLGADQTTALRAPLSVCDLRIEHAPHFASLGIPAFACTPDLFPAMMAATLTRQNLHQWAAANNISAAAPEQLP